MDTRFQKEMAASTGNPLFDFPPYYMIGNKGGSLRAGDKLTFVNGKTKTNATVYSASDKEYTNEYGKSFWPMAFFKLDSGVDGKLHEVLGNEIKEFLK
jgi:hypothetical protein